MHVRHNTANSVRTVRMILCGVNMRLVVIVLQYCQYNANKTNSIQSVENVNFDFY